MSDPRRGSALLATLVFTFVLAVAATQAGLLVLRQGQLNRVAAANQTAFALTERFAEEVVGNYAAISRHDGTINDALFPSAPLTGSATELGCTFAFTAEPRQIEAGLVTVAVTETCTQPAAYTRERTLGYLMSPDLRRVVQVFDSHGGALDERPTPDLRHTPPTLSAVSSAGFTVRTSVTSSLGGFLRVVVQTLDPNDPLPLRHVSDRAVAAGASVVVEFRDEFVRRTGDRTIKVYYSPDPFPADGRLRFECPDEPDDACGVSHLYRIAYTPPAGG